jgi:hypothetical protein
LRYYDASDLKNVRYGCTEYAIKRITGINVLGDRDPTTIGFENVPDVTDKVVCTYGKGLKGFKTKRGVLLEGAMIRTVPAGQDERHTVLIKKVRKTYILIEDQFDTIKVNLASLDAEWQRTGRLYAWCRGKK